MKQRWMGLLLMVLISMAVFGARASEAVPDELLHEALLEDCFWRKDVECWAEGHEILGTEREGDTVRVYMAASVGGYGFIDGGFSMQSGWGGPCTVVLRQREGVWSIEDFLEIESYNEIETIMPKDMAQKYFARTDDAWIQEQIRAQVQAYLDSIGRSEPIIDYVIKTAEPRMLATASNLLNFQDYPRGDTTMECLKGGERYLYTRLWTPDQGTAAEQVYSTDAHGTLHVAGAPGTLLLTKTRKSDGERMETITCRVDLYHLKVTFEDANGWIAYDFDFDGWEYHQPSITYEGVCGVNTEALDRYSEDLLGTRTGMAQVEMQQKITDDECFTLYRDGSNHTLSYSTLQNGAWVEVWRNEKLLPRTSLPVYFGFSDADSLIPHEYPRFTRERGDTLGIYAGEEHPELAVTLSRNAQGVWEVQDYSSNMTGLYAYLLPECMIVNAAELTALQTAGIWMGSVDIAAATFDPNVIWVARDALQGACQDAPNIEYFADAEPLYMALSLDVKLPVYTAPNAAGARAASGKASVSFDEWVIGLCKTDNWMMVLYETSAGHYRTGWVDTSAHETLKSVCEFVMPAKFLSGQEKKTVLKAPLYDDPINCDKPLLTIPKNTAVTVLWTDDVLLPSYVQVQTQNDVWRGFVWQSNLE